MNFISLVIVLIVVFCSFALIIVDEIKYRKKLDPIIRDIIKDAKRR